MSIVEFVGPPSWPLEASKTGGSTKCPWVGVGRVHSALFSSQFPSLGCHVLKKRKKCLCNGKIIKTFFIPRNYRAVS